MIYSVFGTEIAYPEKCF